MKGWYECEHGQGLGRCPDCPTSDEAAAREAQQEAALEPLRLDNLDAIRERLSRRIGNLEAKREARLVVDELVLARKLIEFLRARIDEHVADKQRLTMDAANRVERRRRELADALGSAAHWTDWNWLIASVKALAGQHGDEPANGDESALPLQAQRDEALTLLADAIPDPKGAIDSPQWHRRMDALARSTDV